KLCLELKRQVIIMRILCTTVTTRIIMFGLSMQLLQKKCARCCHFPRKRTRKFDVPFLSDFLNNHYNFNWGMEEMDYSIGVDIGGTKVATAIVDENSNILYRAEVPSFATDKESMFKQVVKSIEMVIDDSDLSIHKIKGMGVGVPGKVDREN